MLSIRTVLKLAAVGSCAVATAGFAQSERSTADSVQKCRAIADTAARVACYDAIEVSRPASPPAVAAPAAAPVAPAPRASGFGSNQLPRSAEPRSPSAASDRIEAGVAAVAEREPGILLLTMQDDTQWLTVDTVRGSYDRPRRGSTVEIVSAAMGSYMMRYAGQPSVRIRRVR